VSLSGFKPYSENVTIGSGVVTVTNIGLELLEVSGTVNVAVDDDNSISTDPAPAASFKQDNFQTLPLATERFLDALPLVPGVVRGPDGLLNVKGARASQSGLTVNSTNVTDPVTVSSQSIYQSKRFSQSRYCPILIRPSSVNSQEQSQRSRHAPALKNLIGRLTVFFHGFVVVVVRLLASRLLLPGSPSVVLY
jgi:hypothetical protein